MPSLPGWLSTAVCSCSQTDLLTQAQAHIAAIPTQTGPCVAQVTLQALALWCLSDRCSPSHTLPLEIVKFPLRSPVLTQALVQVGALPSCTRPAKSSFFAPLQTRNNLATTWLPSPSSRISTACIHGGGDGEGDGEDAGHEPPPAVHSSSAIPGYRPFLFPRLHGFLSNALTNKRKVTQTDPKTSASGLGKLPTHRFN